MHAIGNASITTPGAVSMLCAQGGGGGVGGSFAGPSSLPNHVSGGRLTPAVSGSLNGSFSMLFPHLRPPQPPGVSGSASGGRGGATPPGGAAHHPSRQPPMALIRWLAAVAIQRWVRGFLVRSRRGLADGFSLSRHVGQLIAAATLPENLVSVKDAHLWQPHW
jgi:hypothetical protein